MSRNKVKPPLRVDTIRAPEVSTTPVTYPDGKKISETALAFLYKEYDNLKDLYIQAEHTAQSIFNFYLTLITTIGGGIVILMQVTEKNAINPVQSEVTVSGMLFFITVIGSVYLSSITGRYAHMARYAHGMDQIRHFLMDRLSVPLPPLYQAFFEQARSRQRAGQRRSFMRYARWFMPVSTYVLFIAAFNSLALAISVGLLLFAGGGMDAHETRGSAALVVVVICGLSFIISNIYAHWVRQKLITRLNVQFDSYGELDWIAGKQ